MNNELNGIKFYFTSDVKENGWKENGEVNQGPVCIYHSGISLV